MSPFLSVVLEAIKTFATSKAGLVIFAIAVAAGGGALFINHVKADATERALFQHQIDSLSAIAKTHDADTVRWADSVRKAETAMAAFRDTATNARMQAVRTFAQLEAVVRRRAADTIHAAPAPNIDSLITSAIVATRAAFAHDSAALAADSVTQAALRQQLAATQQEVRDRDSKIKALNGRIAELAPAPAKRTAIEVAIGVGGATLGYILGHNVAR